MKLRYEFSNTFLKINYFIMTFFYYFNYLVDILQTVDF